jgi:hypothetical protein
VPVFRVTRLGQFSPLGQLFSVGSFLTITEVAENFVTIFTRIKWCIYFDKNVLGYYIFGRFFTKQIWSPCFSREPHLSTDFGCLGEALTKFDLFTVAENRATTFDKKF